MTGLVAAARDLAGQLLDSPDLARRWRHVQGAGKRAAQLSTALDLDETDILVAAAWLHDIGYSPAVTDTGLHSLDGARHLQREGWPERIVALVAHHTCARFEAEARGLSAELAAYPCEDSPVMDALVTVDLTTNPDGQPITAPDRIAEILRRYPADHAVHTAITRARPILLEHVNRTQDRLHRAQARQGPRHQD